MEEGPAASLGETLFTWRAGHQALVARGSAADGMSPVDEGADAEPPGRAGRQRAAAAALARAALLEVDLWRPADGVAVVAALGARRGARAAAVIEATRLLERALASPTIERARRGARLIRDVPVAVAADGAVVEDRLDLVWEEQGELVVVRVDTGSTDRIAPGLPPAALASALGQPVRELLVLDLAA
jgi:hypothetical protein